MSARPASISGRPLKQKRRRANTARANVDLLAICQELGIRSVLTTEVINWARSSVKECDLAWRLGFHAVRQRRLPKRLEPALVMLRDLKLHALGGDELKRLAQSIKDNNYRIFAEDAVLHLVSSGLQLEDSDPLSLFDRLMQTGPDNVDPSHAFYLGYELAKSSIALTLGKDYRQDEALDWGMLTVEEARHRLKRAKKGEKKEGNTSGD